MTTTKNIGGGNANAYGGPGSARTSNAGKAQGATQVDLKATGGVVPAGKTDKVDGKVAAKVDVSSSGLDKASSFKKAFDIAKATPDVREDRVAALKAQIDAGTYKVDSGAIADGMAREAILEHLAETEGR